jgi:hypothetical protein
MPAFKPPAHWINARFAYRHRHLIDDGYGAFLRRMMSETEPSNDDIGNLKLLVRRILDTQDGGDNSAEPLLL